MTWTAAEIALFHQWYGEDAVPNMNEPPPCMPEVYYHYGRGSPAIWLSMLPAWMMVIILLLRAMAER